MGHSMALSGCWAGVRNPFKPMKGHCDCLGIGDGHSFELVTISPGVRIEDFLCLAIIANDEPEVTAPAIRCEFGFGGDTEDNSPEEGVFGLDCGSDGLKESTLLFFGLDAFENLDLGLSESFFEIEGPRGV